MPVPPIDSVWLSVVDTLPSLAIYIDPVVPDNDAVGFPAATFVTANFALSVDVPPSTRSVEVLRGYSTPS